MFAFETLPFGRWLWSYWPVHARGVRARTHARVGGWVEVGIAQTRRENHILFYSSLSNGASKLSYQLKLILHCKVQLFRERP